MNRKPHRSRSTHLQVELLEERALMSVVEAQLAGDYAGYAITNMPDIDQLRATIEPLTLGLPNNGAMYCVPTSAMNLVAYIANHGYPNVGPGPGDWQQGPPNNFGVYNNMSQDLMNLGSLMGTDPVNGTGGTGALNGLTAYLDTGAPGDFVVSHFYSHDSYAPTLHDMAVSAIQGNLVEPVVGWYSNADTNLPHDRQGGHALSLVEAHTGLIFGPSAETIGFSDPADDGDPSTQSTFVDSQYNVHEVTGTFGGSQRTLSRIDGYGSAYLDEYFAIQPKYALSADVNHFIFNYPIFLDGGPERQFTRAFASATGGNILDLAISPEGSRHPYLIAGSDTVWQIDSITGESSPLAHVVHPQAITFGGTDMSLYVLTDSQLIRLSRDGRPEDSAPLKSSLDAITYDTSDDMLVGVSLATKQLYFFDHNLRSMGQAALPDEVVHSISGVGVRLSLAAATDGSLFLHQDGSTAVFHLMRNVTGGPGWQAQQVTLQGAKSPQALSVDDKGHLFVTDGGVMAEHDATGAPVTNSKFTGLRGGQVVQILRSFTNFDPTQHTGPAYFNVLPANAVQPPSPTQGQPPVSTMPSGPQQAATPIMDVTTMLSIQVTTLKSKRVFAGLFLPSVKQQVTITNRSDMPIHGPFYFLMEGLKKKTRLKNRHGTSTMHVPGTPYVALDLDMLAPGSSFSFLLTFTGQKPHYSPVVLAGTGTV